MPQLFSTSQLEFRPISFLSHRLGVNARCGIQWYMLPISLIHSFWTHNCFYLAEHLAIAMWVLQLRFAFQLYHYFVVVSIPCIFVCVSKINFLAAFKIIPLYFLVYTRLNLKIWAKIYWSNNPLTARSANQESGLLFHSFTQAGAGILHILAHFSHWRLSIYSDPWLVTAAVLKSKRFVLKTFENFYFLICIVQFFRNTSRFMRVYRVA